MLQRLPIHLSPETHNRLEKIVDPLRSTPSLNNQVNDNIKGTKTTEYLHLITNPEKANVEPHPPSDDNNQREWSYSTSN